MRVLGLGLSQPTPSPTHTANGAGGFAVPTKPPLRRVASPVPVCGNDVQEYSTISGHIGNRFLHQPWGILRDPFFAQVY